MIRASFRIATCLTAALVAGAASANYVYLDPADFTGTRSTADGSLLAPGNPNKNANSWQINGGYKLTWDISFDGIAGMYTYTYEFFRENGSPVGISHFNLETSLDFAGAKTIKPHHGSNPTQPSNLFGIKFEEQGDILEAVLITDRAPVWGDVYGKKGTAGFYNAAFGTNPTDQTTDFSGWIATPNSVTTPPSTVIPTPAALGGGLLLLGAMAFRRRRDA